MSADYDSDDIADVHDIDDDGDFINDQLDNCHYSLVGFKSTGSLMKLKIMMMTMTC